MKLNKLMVIGICILLMVVLLSTQAFSLSVNLECQPSEALNNGDLVNCGISLDDSSLLIKGLSFEIISMPGGLTYQEFTSDFMFGENSMRFAGVDSDGIAAANLGNLIFNVVDSNMLGTIELTVNELIDSSNFPLNVDSVVISNEISNEANIVENIGDAFGGGDSNDIAEGEGFYDFDSDEIEDSEDKCISGAINEVGNLITEGEFKGCYPSQLCGGNLATNPYKNNCLRLECELVPGAYYIESLNGANRCIHRQSINKESPEQNVIDISDVRSFSSGAINNWKSSSESYDLNGDGEVSFADIRIMLFMYNNEPVTSVP